MDINVSTQSFTMTPAINDHLLRRLWFALGARSRKIHRIKVHLSDVNGPRGGRDKRCKIMIRLSGQPDIVVEDTHSDLYEAIDRASGRAGMTLNRRLAKLSKRLRAPWRKNPSRELASETVTPLEENEEYVDFIPAEVYEPEPTSWR